MSRRRSPHRLAERLPVESPWARASLGNVDLGGAVARLPAGRTLGEVTLGIEGEAEGYGVVEERERGWAEGRSEREEPRTARKRKSGWGLLQARPSKGRSGHAAAQALPASCVESSLDGHPRPQTDPPPRPPGAAAAHRRGPHPHARLDDQLLHLLRRPRTVPHEAWANTSLERWDYAAWVEVEQFGPTTDLGQSVTLGTPADYGNRSHSWRLVGQDGSLNSNGTTDAHHLLEIRPMMVVEYDN